MLEKTRGIVLKVTDYRDTSVIVQVFTERFGMQSFLVQGAKRKNARFPVNMMQPLQLWDMVFRHRMNANLQRLTEIRLFPPFTSIPYEVEKTTVVLFINEVLYKCLRHQGPDESLFQFIYHAVSWLDSIEDMPSDFHLFFLLRLSRFLGFYPSLRREGDRFFDLKEGVYLRFEPNHSFVLTGSHMERFAQLIEFKLENLHQAHSSREERRILLTKIIEYYQLHVDNLGEIKSQAVLEEVLS